MLLFQGNRILSSTRNLDFKKYTPEPKKLLRASLNGIPVLTSVHVLATEACYSHAISQVIETIVKVSPVRGAQLFAPVLLKIFHMILEVEVVILTNILFLKPFGKGLFG